MNKIQITRKNLNLLDDHYFRTEDPYGISSGERTNDAISRSFSTESLNKNYSYTFQPDYYDNDPNSVHHGHYLFGNLTSLSGDFRLDNRLMAPFACFDYITAAGKMMMAIKNGYVNVNGTLLHFPGIGVNGIDTEDLFKNLKEGCAYNITIIAYSCGLDFGMIGYFYENLENITSFNDKFDLDYVLSASTNNNLCVTEDIYSTAYRKIIKFDSDETSEIFKVLYRPECQTKRVIIGMVRINEAKGKSFVDLFSYNVGVPTVTFIKDASNVNQLRRLAVPGDDQ